MQGIDVFTIAGTGAGKSLTYILCPLICDNKVKTTHTTLDTLDSVRVIFEPGVKFSPKYVFVGVQGGVENAITK